VFEVRRKNLERLIQIHGTIAHLNEVLGRRRKDSTLSQYRNATLIKKTGTKSQMGEAIARTIEKKLRLGYGWMDNEHIEGLEPDITDSEAIQKNLTVKIRPLETLSAQKKVGAFQDYLKGIEMTEYFLSRVLFTTDKDNLRTFLVDDDSLKSVAPFGSVVLIDTGVKSYTKDGLYLVEINGALMLKRIIAQVDGTFIVANDVDKQQVNNLNLAHIVGRACYLWAGRNV